MKKIAEIVEHIQCELEDAEEYAKASLRYAAEDTRLAETYKRLGQLELEHADSLHEQAVRTINGYQGTPPEGMLKVWEWEHKKYIDAAARVKSLLASV